MMTFRNVRTVLLAFCLWQLCCLFLRSHTEQIVDRLIFSAYTYVFGGLQGRHSSAARLTTLLGTMAITVPATILSLWVCHILSPRGLIAHRGIVAFVGWEAAVTPVLQAAYEIGFSMWIHDLLQSPFWPFDDLYGYWNLVVHRVLAWLICTTPVSLAALVVSLRFAAAAPLAVSVARSESADRAG